MNRECFICGDGNEKVLQQHHVVPKRYGGSDRDDNLVWLCASCHQAIERLYDDDFYQRLGVSKESNKIAFEPVGSVDDFVDNELYYDFDKEELYRYKGRTKMHSGYGRHEFARIYKRRRSQKLDFYHEELKKIMANGNWQQIKSELSDKIIIKRVLD